MEPDYTARLLQYLTPQLLFYWWHEACKVISLFLSKMNDVADVEQSRKRNNAHDAVMER